MLFPIYQVLSPVDYRRGGITRNVLKRARLLAARLDQPVHVLSFDFNPDYGPMRDGLTELGLIDDSVVIHNLFEDLAPTESRGNATCVSQAIKEPGFTVVPTDASRTFRVLDNGVAVRQKTYAPDGHLSTLQYLDERGHTVTAEHYDSLGRLRQTDVRDHDTSRTILSQFLHSDSLPYVIVEYDAHTADSTSVTLLDHDDPAKVLRRYEDLHELTLEWLSGYAAQHELAYFLTDYRNADSLVVELEDDRVIRVKTLHTNHLAHPFVYGSALRSRARIELGNARSFDALVLLSEQQHHDVMRQFGPRSTYHVVNNPAPDTRGAPQIAHDPFKAVGVGRYHDLKRWDYAIDAFRTVVDVVPNAKLEIWGFGPARTTLQSQIDRLGLEDHVSLKGIALDSASVFAGAAFSVLSSPAEGFPLVPMESMAVGTPVVAFNANYGLADQIRSGVDGILVDSGDTDGLARAMIELFTDRYTREQMSEQARTITNRLSESVYVDAWVGVLEAAAEQHGRRVEMHKPHAEVHALSAEPGHITIVGTLEFDSVPADLEVSLYVRTRERPLTDHYYDAATHVDATAPVVRFTIRLPAAELAMLGETWDVFLSCSARNAHVFARACVGTGVNLPSARVGAVMLKPYRTKNGNLSIRTAAYRTLKQRLARRARHMLRRAR